MPYSDHLRAFLARLGDFPALVPRAVLGFGARNVVQNLWLPVYDATCTPTVVCRQDEPLGSTTYHAFCFFRIAGALRVAIRRIRFAQVQEQWTVNLVDQGAESIDTLEFAFTGQPILLDGEVSPHDLIAAVTYDLRHAWHLEWEDWQKNPSAFDTHSRLMDVMMSMRESPVGDRARELGRIATEAGLRIEDGYYHSSISVSPDGRTINWMAFQGSFDQIAAAHRNLGARDAILLDNGGSVGAAIWHRRAWAEALKGGRTVPPEPVFFGNNTYFRPRGHAIVLLEFEDDFSELAFRRPDGQRAG
jgi:hypothetical protein